MTQIIAIQRQYGGYIWNYIKFFWAIGWKTFAVAMFTALIVGTGLGILSNIQGWPPEGLPFVATMVGLPITLLVMGWVVYLQVRDFVTKQGYGMN